MLDCICLLEISSAIVQLLYSKSAEKLDTVITSDYDP